MLHKDLIGFELPNVRLTCFPLIRDISSSHAANAEHELTRYQAVLTAMGQLHFYQLQLNYNYVQSQLKQLLSSQLKLLQLQNYL